MSDEPKVLIGRSAEGPGLNVWLWCPGCVELHRVQVPDEEGGAQPGPQWSWNGDLVKPTIEPSILVRGGRQPGHACHSFLRDGAWEFLPDSTHPLAGETVVMTEMPHWMRKAPAVP